MSSVLDFLHKKIILLLEIPYLLIDWFLLCWSLKSASSLLCADVLFINVCAAGVHSVAWPLNVQIFPTRCTFLGVFFPQSDCHTFYLSTGKDPSSRSDYFMNTHLQTCPRENRFPVHFCHLVAALLTAHLHFFCFFGFSFIVWRNKTLLTFSCSNINSCGELSLHEHLTKHRKKTLVLYLWKMATMALCKTWTSVFFFRFF